jgi:hypothetical protein
MKKLFILIFWLAVIFILLKASEGIQHQKNLNYSGDTDEGTATEY